MLPVKLLGLNC